MTHRHPVNRKLIDGRGRTDRAVDRFVVFFGSLRFIGWMTGLIIGWIVLNTAVVVRHWDPYPFILLNLLFSTQASYAAPLILLSQNRAAEHDRLKAEDDYRVNQAALTEIRALRLLLRELAGLPPEDSEETPAPCPTTDPAS